MQTQLLKMFRTAKKMFNFFQKFRFLHSKQIYKNANMVVEL